MIAFANRGGRRRHTHSRLHRPAAVTRRPRHWRPFLFRFFDAFRLAY